jgi:hypothetical protein
MNAVWLPQEVEVDVSRRGLQKTTVVGLAKAQVKESIRRAKVVTLNRLRLPKPCQRRARRREDGGAALDVPVATAGNRLAAPAARLPGLSHWSMGSSDRAAKPIEAHTLAEIVAALLGSTPLLWPGSKVDSYPLRF